MPDYTKILRLIAEFGVTWTVGITAPYISTDEGPYTVAPSDLGSLVKDGLLTASLIDADTAQPKMDYRLTVKATYIILSYFKHASIDLSTLIKDR